MRKSRGGWGKMLNGEGMEVKKKGGDKESWGEKSTSCHQSCGSMASAMPGTY